jgi:hypothetical protein
LRQERPRLRLVFTSLRLRPCAPAQLCSAPSWGLDKGTGLAAALDWGSCCDPAYFNRLPRSRTGNAEPWPEGNSAVVPGPRPATGNRSHPSALRGGARTPRLRPEALCAPEAAARSGQALFHRRLHSQSPDLGGVCKTTTAHSARGSLRKNTPRGQAAPAERGGSASSPPSAVSPPLPEVMAVAFLSLKGSLLRAFRSALGWEIVLQTLLVPHPFPFLRSPLRSLTALLPCAALLAIPAMSTSVPPYSYRGNSGQRYCKTASLPEMQMFGWGCNSVIERLPRCTSFWFKP